MVAATYYYTRDHLGSVREMVSYSGTTPTIQARYDYDPYGRTTLVSGTNLSDFQYAGYYAHQASGLNLTMYRAYDPNTAKWLSRDPLGEGSDATLYSYVRNGPVDLTDLDGLAAYGAVQTQQTLSAAASAATAGAVQGLINIATNSQGNGQYDFGSYGLNDTYNVNGTTLTSGQFANYVAGYEAAAYDNAYGGGLAYSLVIDAGTLYHVAGITKDPQDVLDGTGIPLIEAGKIGEEASADSSLLLLSNQLLQRSLGESAEVYARTQNGQNSSCR